MHAKVSANISLGDMHGIAPLVISASRTTDLPAFHAKWFINRLREGYCIWRNPFNKKQNIFISFEECRVIVFWSKNPAPIIPYLDEIAARGFKFYFQFTLNEYVEEGLEPHIPELQHRIATFRHLAEKIGKDRVIWRFDPILATDALTPERILQRIDTVGKLLNNYTSKLIFSFADITAYARVAANLAKICPSARELKPEEQLIFGQNLAALNAQWKYPLILATCAEQNDFSAYGIIPNSCIDNALICRLCHGDKEIQQKFGNVSKQLSLTPQKINNLQIKNLGRRAACACAPSKDIGDYNFCGHLCAYCYANHFKRLNIL